MPLYDQAKVVKLISELRNSVNQLKRLKVCQISDFIHDEDKIGSTKYHFIVAIECCVDMCQHIIARNGYRAPENYSETFKVIGEAGAFSQDQLNTFIKMAKFRNRLVHLYWEIDNQQVYDILQNNLNDFHVFMEVMSVFLDLKEIQD